MTDLEEWKRRVWALMERVDFLERKYNDVQGDVYSLRGMQNVIDRKYEEILSQWTREEGKGVS